MNENKLVISSLIWRFAERCGAQSVTLIVSVILARILETSAHGTIAIVTVLISILQTFVDSGLGNALIQKKDADELDFSTVFYFNILLCLVLYSILYFVSPLISIFFGDDSLISLIRVLGISVIISGLKNIQQAYVSKTMQFRKFFFSTLGGTISSAIVGISMAYWGYGVWALIAQQLTSIVVDTFILWVTLDWRPIRAFSLNRLKGLFGFGWKLMLSSLIDRVYNELRQLIIGKVYTTNDLAFYNKGKQFPNLIISNVNTSIDSVLFPAMSGVQDNKMRIKNMTRRSIKTSTYFLTPMLLGLFVIAEPFVILILTSKWLSCVTFLRIFCLVFIFYPVNTANLNAIKAMGRSDIYLKLEIIKKVIGFMLLIVTMFVSVKALAYSLLVSSIISQFINSWPNKMLLNYSFKEQMLDIFPSLVLSIIMGVVIWPISYIKINSILIIILQIVCGIIIYILLSYIFKIETFNYIVKKILAKRRV